ncbi:1,2-phenylacetyl-CoA epoxidase subunit PaaC [Tranquillimonas alkanivorans]|uniref:Ring-1,2-phenylacetyl-CoA epoxidase subunit PaaC n=1 Tax=Tranquillimonas alkanivorans TaxID=441119 RepID=A0A1I5S976_9RHOB|nr:1,2-phenylacetyl-CoA epoxidase subunit PaaC [Tranquillimonas alkanivorans]SFP66826.1 ring-1,2-phenylacetyl-CoA epoxidase subunit PaaC [Tranquillimonas alkanivorans]
MDAFVTFCLRMGDNALILGQRTAEWCGHAPVLEEDIAFANMGLDLIGQTQLWYGLAAEAEGKGRTPDDLAFLRPERQFLNSLLVEQPNTDFGHALMRQYLFDAWHLPMQEELAKSSHEGVRGLAQKTVKEVRYHLDRSRDLIVRLGDGSEESHKRMQDALDWLWPFTADLLATDEVDAQMADEGIAPVPALIAKAFDAETQATLARATLTIPETRLRRTGGRDGIHTEHMGYILAEMQSLQRTYPGARW